MPAATNLVIKNAAGTDKTFTLINPAAGDGGLATWALKEGSISSVFPTITALARKTPTGRTLRVKIRLPSSFTDAVTGLTNVGSHAEFNGSWTIPDNFPVALKPDQVAFVKNAIAATLLQSMAEDATPAT